MTTALSEVNTSAPKRILLFGMRCGFTEVILDGLRATPVADVRAIVLPGTEAAEPEPSSSWTAHIDSPGGATVIELAGRRALTSPTVLASLAALDIDVIVVACFPWRLPAPVRALPRFGSVNVHPSLLPDGRGPAPVFWTFRRNLEITGVTVHFLDEGWDTGPIVERRTFALAGDETMITLERSLARIGAEMVARFLADPVPWAAAQPQPQNEGRPAPFPEADDLLVTTAWSASAAARFIEAVRPVYGPIEVLVLASGRRLAVAEVLMIEHGASAAPAVRLQQDRAWIRFSDGLLHCRLRLADRRLAFGI